MTLPTHFLTFSLAIVFLAQAGCQYNGAMPSGTNKQTRAQIKQFIHDQQVKRELAAAEARKKVKGPPNAWADAAQTAGSAHPVGSAKPSGAPAYTQRPAVGMLGLYGQVFPVTPQKTSPLDGGGNLRRVTVTPEGADFDPDIDPTGQLLAYASTGHRQTSDIYIKRIGGATITQITNDPANDVMPAFSPDGSKIAFASDRSGNWDIYVMDAKGGRPVQITTDPTHDIHPSFSPDGTKLVYASYGAPSGQWEMVMVDLKAPSSKKYIGNGLFPTWSPVANTILFQRARQRGTRWFSVWTVDVADGEAGSPTEVAASANAACITPDWSADGKNIVFCTVIDPASDDLNRPGQADVWLMKADGTSRVRLTQGQFANLQPVWSVDRSIFFVSNRGPEGTDNIWSVRSDQAVRLAANTAGGPATQMPSVRVPTE